MNVVKDRLWLMERMKIARIGKRTERKASLKVVVPKRVKVKSLQRRT